MPRKTPRQIRNQLADQRAAILADEQQSPTTSDEDRRKQQLAKKQHELHQRQQAILQELPEAAVIDLSKIPDEFIPEEIQALPAEEPNKTQRVAGVSLGQSQALKYFKYWQLEKEIRQLATEHNQIERIQMLRLFPEGIEIVAQDGDSLTVKIDLRQSLQAIIEDLRDEIWHRQANRKAKQALKSDPIRRRIRAFPSTMLASEIAKAMFPEEYTAGGKKRRAAVERVRYHRSKP